MKGRREDEEGVVSARHWNLQGRDMATLRADEIAAIGICAN